MNLIQELMALSEARKHTMYQVKISDNAQWEDLEFPFETLDVLVKEITAHPSELDDVFALPEVHALVSDFYGGRHGDTFDVVDEDYDVKSFKDDVLKIQYGFTMRFKSDREPRKVNGVMTIMPGN